MKRFPQVLYKSGGNVAIEGLKYSIKIVHHAGELESELADGWSETTISPPAQAAPPAPPAQAQEQAMDQPAALDRQALAAQAHALGIEFDGRTTDRKLLERINAKG